MRSEEADRYILKINNNKTPYFKTVSKIKLKINPGIYPTGKIGKLFAKALALPEIGLVQKKVLDYGTGTGFLAILAASKGAQVVAIDKNSLAVDCARYNAKINNLEKQIDFRVSDSLSAISKHEQFDLVLAGLPWEDAIPNTLLEMAFYDQNFSMREALAERASDNLIKQTGIILLSYCKRVEERIPISQFFCNFEIKTLLEKNINDEPHYIYFLRKKD